MSVEDVIFQIRHDPLKVNRLLDFLSWKDVRKNVKGASGGGDDDIIEEQGISIAFARTILLR